MPKIIIRAAMVAVLGAYLFVAPALRAQTTGTTTGTTTGAGANTLVVDTFETGVDGWSRNDKTRSGLVDILLTGPGAGGSSRGAALITFKAAQNSWASLSRPINGAAWAKIGAQRLAFSLEGNGDAKGVEVQLRARSNGAETAFKLPQPVRLDAKNWRRVVIPLSDFKGPRGESVLPSLNTVYLLQFVQTGSWESKFFSLDDFAVEGTGKPLGGTATPAPPTTATTATARPVATTAATPAGPGGAIAVGADFLRDSGPIRAVANPSLGVSGVSSVAGVPRIESARSFRSALLTLKPRYVRLDVSGLATLTDSSRPSFDFAPLVLAAKRARSIGAEPLIAVSNPAQWGLDPRGYAALATGAARAVNAGTPLSKTFELVSASPDYDAATALRFYNAAYDALKAQSKTYRVGGIGGDANDRAEVATLLGGARGLDFLTVSFFSSGNNSTRDNATVLRDAKEIPGLKTVAGLLDKSRFPRAAIFVTSANLSNASLPGETAPSDPRLAQNISAAWWAQFLASGSRLADQIFHNDASNPEWGLLDGSAQAYPAYYSMWLWNTYFPSGSRRVAANSVSDALLVTAANTKTAHNMMLVNTTEQPQTAQITIRGFPVLREARIRIYDPRTRQVQFEQLPKSPFQTVRLVPGAVAVLQFIEPPKS